MIGEIHQHVDGANQLPGFIEDGCWIGGKGYARSILPDASNGMTFLLFTIAREKSRGFEANGKHRLRFRDESLRRAALRELQDL